MLILTLMMLGCGGEVEPEGSKKEPGVASGGGGSPISPVPEPTTGRGRSGTLPSRT